MNRVRRAALAITVLLVTACQGSLSSGPSLPFTPPPGGVSPLSGETPQANQTPASLAAQTVTYALSSAADGFACSDTNGYSCLLRFNLPKESSGAPKQKPSPAPRTAAPSASPTSPLEDAVSNSSAPAATASPSGPTMALTMTALPNDAPKMVITSKTPLATVALVRVQLVPSDDFTLNGHAVAQFTLPHPELVDRGFAVQVFGETTHGKKHTTTPIITIARSALEGSTLTFRFTPPKLTIPKGRHYLIVLYGDARPATPTPVPSPNPFLSPSPLPTQF